MNNAEKFKRLIMFMTSLVLICALTLCYSFVWIKYYNKSSPHFAAGMFYLKGNVLLYGVYALMFMLFSRIYKGYRIGFLKLTDIVYSQCLSLVCVNVITYFQICLIARLMFNPLPIVIMTVVQAFVICVWAVLSNRLFSKLYPPKKMVIVYGSRLAVSLVEKMCARDDRFCICRSIRADEDFEEIKRVIMEYEAVIICDIPGQRRNDILKFCFANSKRTYITPKISDIIIRGAEDMNMFDTPLLLCRNSGLNAEQAAIKRFMDIILSLIALVVLSPFMLITAAAIKLYDHGPVFYTQDRLTVGGRIFKVYKFRSMIVDAEKNSGARLASQNDNRITPIGRIIRKIRFDELPQLINILKGDMSIVGPRPERPELAAISEESMPEFSYRLKVKAGLTGYAQVMGKYNTTPYDKLKLDLAYIENYSLMLDIKLILMTVKILFVPESTEGVKEVKTVNAAEKEKESANK